MLKALHAAAAMALAWTLCLPTVATALPQSDLTRFSDRSSDWANGADIYDSYCDRGHRLEVHGTTSYILRCVDPNKDI